MRPAPNTYKLIKYEDYLGLPLRDYGGGLNEGDTMEKSKQQYQFPIQQQHFQCNINEQQVKQLLPCAQTMPQIIIVQQQPPPPQSSTAEQVYLFYISFINLLPL